MIYLTGCIEAVLDFVWNHLDIFAGILLGIFLPQVGLTLKKGCPLTTSTF